MPADLVSLSGRDHSKVFALRGQLAREFGLGVSDALRAETCCITLLAGAGTRWKRTLKAAQIGWEAWVSSLDAQTLEAARSFPLDWPRGLFPVRDYIREGEGRIPLAAYAVDALKRVGNLCVVIRGWEDEVRRQILLPLGIDPEKVLFHSQSLGPSGKPLGHGDAVYQAMGCWRKYKYLIVNFAGDANSPLTVLLGLRCMEELEHRGLHLGLLLPAAPVDNPVYPIVLDEDGIPRQLGHDKLKGPAANAGPAPAADFAQPSTGYTNVGIRIYRTTVLAEAMNEIRAMYWNVDSGYAIPGNDPAQREFALDNVEEYMAQRGQARILAVARPQELTPAKSFDEINNFERALKAVRAEWDGLTADSKQGAYRRAGDRVERTRS